MAEPFFNVSFPNHPRSALVKALTVDDIISLTCLKLKLPEGDYEVKT